MCSVTFLPQPAEKGFFFVMNRDELRSRPAAQPPVVSTHSGGLSIYPREADGGTWIAATEGGTVFALLNWSVFPPASRAPTRGRLIPLLLEREGSFSLRQAFGERELAGTNPFRLLCCRSEDSTIDELRWDGSAMRVVSHSWSLSHWFSSGFAETDVVASRRRSAEEARSEQDYGTTKWVLRLHAGHHPGKGAFSICMHRSDARTVSQTVIRLTNDHIGMEYRDGPPCSPSRESHRVTLVRTGDDSSATRRHPCAQWRGPD